MKTKLEKNLMKEFGGTAWDGIITILAKTAFDDRNPKRFRLRVRLDLWVLPMASPLIIRHFKNQQKGK